MTLRRITLATTLIPFLGATAIAQTPSSSTSGEVTISDSASSIVAETDKATVNKFISFNIYGAIAEGIKRRFLSGRPALTLTLRARFWSNSTPLFPPEAPRSYGISLAFINCVHRMPV